MDDQNSMAQLRYLEEAANNLKRVGFEVGCVEDQHLPVSWNGSYPCRISGKGSVLYRQDLLDALGAQAELAQVVNIANTTREYMAMMEYAPPLKAQGLTGDYRILADFNTSVLAGHPSERGVQFVVWEWNHDRRGVRQGGYDGDKPWNKNMVDRILEDSRYIGTDRFTALNHGGTVQRRSAAAKAIAA